MYHYYLGQGTSATLQCSGCYAMTVRIITLLHTYYSMVPKFGTHAPKVGF